MADKQIKRCSQQEMFNKDKALYYVAFTLYVGWEWLNRTTLWDLDISPIAAGIEKLVQIAVILLLAFCFFRQKASVGEWFTAIAIGALGFIVWRTAAEGWLFWLTLFVVCGKGVQIKPLALIAAVTVAGVLLLAVLASSFSLIENVVSVRVDGTTRMAMGFAHPNSFGASFFVVCMGLIPVVKKEKWWVISLLGLLGAYLSLQLADSRTSAICLLGVAVTLPIYTGLMRKPIFKKGAVCLVVLLLALAAISVFYMLFFDPARPLDAFFDRLLSGRLRLSHTYYLDHAPGIFGYNYNDGTVYYTGDKKYTFVVDNLYAHILLRHGIVAWVAFLGGLFTLFIKMSKERYVGSALYGMALFLAYGMSETLGCRIEFNFYIIGLWTVLYHRPISEFDDTACEEPSGSASDSIAEELSFLEFVMLPINMLRRRHG